MIFLFLLISPFFHSFSPIKPYFNRLSSSRFTVVVSILGSRYSPPLPPSRISCSWLDSLYQSAGFRCGDILLLSLRHPQLPVSPAFTLLLLLLHHLAWHFPIYTPRILSYHDPSQGAITSPYRRGTRFPPAYRIDLIDSNTASDYPISGPNIPDN